MGLLMLAAMPGDKIVLETTGAQAIEGLKALSNLIKKIRKIVNTFPDNSKFIPIIVVTGNVC